MKDNGIRFFKGSKFVHDKEWDVTAHTPNKTGPDTVKVFVVNKATGKSYAAKATI